MKKKYLLVFLLLVAAFAFTACGNNETTPADAGRNEDRRDDDRRNDDDRNADDSEERRDADRNVDRDDPHELPPLAEVPLVPPPDDNLIAELLVGGIWVLYDTDLFDVLGIYFDNEIEFFADGRGVEWDSIHDEEDVFTWYVDGYWLVVTTSFGLEMEYVVEFVDDFELLLSFEDEGLGLIYSIYVRLW